MNAKGITKFNCQLCLIFVIGSKQICTVDKYFAFVANNFCSEYEN